MMLLEWLRRHDPALDEHMRTYLFTDGPITEVEARASRTSSGNGPSAGQPGSLGLGGARREEP